MTTLDLRDNLIEARKRFGRGEIGVDELNKIADEYIAAIKAYSKQSGKRIATPSRAYLLRAL